MNEMAQLHHETTLFISRSQHLKAEDKQSPSDAAKEKLLSLTSTLSKLEERVHRNSNDQARLSVGNENKGSDRSEESLNRLAHIRDWLTSYETLWNSLEDWQGCIKKWRVISIRDLNLKELKAASGKYEEIAQALAIKLRSSPGRVRLAQEIADFKGLTDLLEQLQSPSLKAEHWEALRPFFGHNAHSDSPLSDVLDANLASRNRSTSNVEKIATVTRNAIRDHMLDTLYERVVEQWQRATLELYDFSDDEFMGMRPRCLSSLELLAVVKSTHGQLSSVTNVWVDKASKGPVHKLHRRISLVSATLKKMTSCQTDWMRLANMFADPTSSTGRFPADARAAYQMVLTIWCKCVRQLEEQKNPLDALSTPGVLEAIELCCAKLHHIKWNLQPYLESRRNKFPRLYFLSGDDTFDLLSKSEVPDEVINFFPRLYTGISSFKFLRPPKRGINTTITGVWSHQRELLKFRESVRIGHGVPVEEWLAELDKGIKSSLWRQIYDASKSIKSDSSILTIITGHPGQVAIVAMRIAWTKQILVQMELSRNKRRDGIASVHHKCDTSMATMAEHLVQGKFSGLHTQSAEAALMLQIYQRDAVAMLIKEKVFQKTDFGWMQHIRMDLDVPNEAVVVHQGLGSFRYGLEYLGAPRALAITPRMLRSFTSLTMALQNNIGGALVGPTQSGKTSLVQSLADICGYMLLTVPIVKDHVHGLYLTGMVRSGVWTCYQSASALPVSTLINFAETFRVVRAEFISSIEATQKASLDAVMGCYIEMPGTPNHEVPQAIKTLFRPTTIGVPDVLVVCESLLISKGFTQARVIAKRLKEIYDIAHRFFENTQFNLGLRIMKLIIYDAISLRRFQKMEEMQAINTCARKFLRAGFVDLEDSEPLMAELFADVDDHVIPQPQPHAQPQAQPQPDSSDAAPQPVPVAPTSQTLEQFVIKACDPISYGAKRRIKLDVLPYQIEAALEVNRSIQDFPGTMILGDPGSGKSTIIELLMKALSMKSIADSSNAGNKDAAPKIHKGFGQVLSVFPNGLKPHELGFEDPTDTQGWKNKTQLIKGLTVDHTTGQPKRTYQVMVCDGDITGKWAEIFTQIIDESKKSMTNHMTARLPLEDNLRLLFELGDAAHTTPALFTRCKLIHIHEALPWKALIHSWEIDFLEEYDYSESLKEQMRQSVVSIMFDLIPAALDYFDSLKSTGRLRHSFRLSANNFVTTFLRMISGVTGEGSGLSKLTSVAAEAAVRILVLRYVVFSWIWSFGGNLEDESLRQEFEVFVRSTLYNLRLKRSESLMTTIPQEGNSLFGYYVDPVTQAFPPWEEKHGTKKKSNQAIWTTIRHIPTAETAALKYLLNALKQSGPVFFYGPRAIGKTLLLNQMVIDDQESQNPNSRFISLNSFTNRTSVRDTFQRMLKSMPLVSAGEHQRLHVIVDDVSMPPLASHPSDVPMALDNLRQLLCRRTVFDHENREYLANNATNPILCYTTHQQGSLPLNPRILTQLAMLGALTPTRPAQESIFSGLFGAFAHTFIPHMELTAIVKAACNLFANIRKHLPASPRKLRKTFDLRDATRFIIAFASAPEEALASSKPGRLFTHEAYRTFVDGLSSASDKEAVGNMIEEEAGTLGPKEKGLAIFSNLHCTVQNVVCVPYQDALAFVASESKEGATSTPLSPVADCTCQTTKEWRSCGFCQMSQVADALQCCNQTATLTSTTGGCLQYFPQNVKQILRLARAISQPQGHAIIAGQQGVGKKTIVHAVSQLMKIDYVLVDWTRSTSTSALDQMVADLCTRCGIDNSTVLLHVPAANLTPGVSRAVVSLATGISFRMISHSQRDRLVQKVREIGSAWSEDLYAMNEHEVLAKLWERTCEKVRIVITATAVTDDWEFPWGNNSNVTSAFTFLWYAPWSQKSMLYIARRRLRGIQNTTTRPMVDPELLVTIFHKTQVYLDAANMQRNTKSHAICSNAFLDFVNAYRSTFEVRVIGATHHIVQLLKAIQFCRESMVSSTELPEKLKVAFQAEEHDDDVDSVDRLLNHQQVAVKQLDADIAATKERIAHTVEKYLELMPRTPSLEEVCGNLATLTETDVRLVAHDQSQVTQIMRIQVCRVLRIADNSDFTTVVGKMANYVPALASMRALEAARKMFAALSSKMSIRDLMAPFQYFWQWLRVVTTPSEAVAKTASVVSNLDEAIKLAMLKGEMAAKQEFLEALLKNEDGTIGASTKKVSMASVVKYLGNKGQQQVSNALEREKVDWVASLAGIRDELTSLSENAILVTACASFFGHCVRHDREKLVDMWSRCTATPPVAENATAEDQPKSSMEKMFEKLDSDGSGTVADAKLEKLAAADGGIINATTTTTSGGGSADNGNSGKSPASFHWPQSFTNFVDGHRCHPDRCPEKVGCENQVDYGPGEVDASLVRQGDAWKVPLILDNQNISIPWIIDAHPLGDLEIVTFSESANVDQNARKMVYNNADVNAVVEADTEDWRAHLIVNQNNIALPWIIKAINLPELEFSTLKDSNVEAVFGAMRKGKTPKHLIVLNVEKAIDDRKFNHQVDTWSSSLFVGDTWRTAKDVGHQAAALDAPPTKFYTTAEAVHIDRSVLAPVYHFELDVEVVQRLVLSTIMDEEATAKQNKWFDATVSLRSQSKQKRMQAEYILSRVTNEMDTCLPTVERQKHIVKHAEHSARIEEAIGEAREVRSQLLDERNVFVPMANKITALYLALDRLADVQPLYFVRFDHFQTNFIAALERARLHATQDSDLTPATRLDHLTTDVMLRMFRLISFGLTETDTLLFAVGYIVHTKLIGENHKLDDAKTIEHCGQLCRGHEWITLRGSLSWQEKPDVAWLSDEQWQLCSELARDAVGRTFPSICKRFTNTRPIMLLHTNEIDTRFVFQSTLKQMAGGDVDYAYCTTRTMTQAQLSRTVQNAMQTGTWVLLEEHDMEDARAVNMVSYLVQDIQSGRITAHPNFRLWVAVPLGASLPPSIVGTCSKVCHEWSSSPRSDLLRRLEIVSNKLEYELEFSTGNTLLNKRFDESFTVFPKLKCDPEPSTGPKVTKAQAHMVLKDEKLQFYKEVCFLLAVFDSTVQARLHDGGVAAYVDSMMYHAAVQLIDQISNHYGRARTFWKPFQRVLVDNIYGWDASAPDRKWLVATAKKMLSDKFLQKALTKEIVEAMKKSQDILAFVQSMDLPKALM